MKEPLRSKCIGRGILAIAALLSGVAARGGDSRNGIVGQPLAARSVLRGLTMFTELAPADTGIIADNRYDDPTMWAERYPQFAFGSTGTGIAIGDYDGDGRPDIFVVNKTGLCRLFRNLSGWKFEDVTLRAGLEDVFGEIGKWNEGATFVDVNNDGRLDLYVCRFGAPNLLFINQGNGTFKEMAHAYGLDVNDACVMASFGDYDRDGWLDVYVQTNLLDPVAHPQGQRDYLFHNQRDGTFTNVTDRAGIRGETQGHSATWWDYDNDGWPDLYVANDFGTPDQLYHNNRDGTFTNVIDQVVPHMPFSSMGSDAGDVNNDGQIDLLAADMAATTHEKDQRGMADTRALLKDPLPGSDQAPQYQRSALFLNTNTGRCLEAANLAGVNATDWTWSPRLEDLDNDGRLDLFVTNGMNREQTNTDLLTRAFADGTPMGYVRVMRNSPVLVESHRAYRNLGDVRFEDTSAAWGLNKVGVSFGTALGDLDGDGDLDIVYANYQQAVTVLRNDCQSGHRVIIALRGTQSNRFGVGAVVRLESAFGIQVRQLWLARGYKSSSDPTVHFGLGDDTRIDRLIVIWPSGIVQTLTNLAVDQRYTVTEAATPGASPAAMSRPEPGQFEDVTGAVGLALSTREDELAETNLQRLLPQRLNRRGPAIAVGAVGADGRDGVVIGGTTLDPLRILRFGTARRFVLAAAGPAASPAPIDDGPVLLFDAEGSGRNDLLVTRGGNARPPGASEYEPRLYRRGDGGEYSLAPDGVLPALPVNAGAVAAADFNRDGRLDLFVGGRVRTGEYPLSPRSALLINRDGRFDDVTDSMAPGLREIGMVTSALWSDVDGDGWPDLLLTLEWGFVRFFHNEQGKHFEDWTVKAGFASAGTGWWNSIAAADFNGDGQPDYVVGNVGLNTQYRADPGHPAVLFYGDFGGGATPQIIEAYYEGDRLYPWRTRRDLGAAIPSVLRRYPRNDDYARATLPEILGEDRLAAALRVAATVLQSGVFLSQPDGTFHFEPLPRLAQIAPLQGIVAGDFDGDGHADIYAVQNSFAPIPAVGRFDGGLSQLLRGDGHGHFAPVPPSESGLVVPGDAKALALIDLDEDGWPDFLVTRNNSTAMAFRNRGIAGRHSLRIQLRGRAGNPTAIGARITVELGDGSMQASEVYAGSGYYSQSSAACFFGYPAGNPPRCIRVRWPLGAKTQANGPAESSALILSEPDAAADHQRK
ncbi:MAG TPA: FG-GAP-like repeat-containing protein [Phycisphaerae bacterium]|nr:FG-GAP-like repeat-containing protein [Phycisphaerae bacterium]